MQLLSQEDLLECAQVVADADMALPEPLVSLHQLRAICIGDGEWETDPLCGRNADSELCHVDVALPVQKLSGHFRQRNGCATGRDRRLVEFQDAVRVHVLEVVRDGKGRADRRSLIRRPVQRGGELTVAKLPPVAWCYFR